MIRRVLPALAVAGGLATAAAAGDCSAALGGSGVVLIHPILLSRDGGSYVYSYPRWLDDLYVVEGLR